MFQTFDATTTPEHAPPRLAALREVLAQYGLDGFLVPRADAHQGEYVAPRDERLAWLTGFSGSAGIAIVLPHTAGLFVDGRYRVQARAQVDTSLISPVPWPDTKPGDWLREQMPNGAVIGFDPWLHTPEQIDRLEHDLAGSEITLRRCRNPVDAIWPDQPGPPAGPVLLHPEGLAGQASGDKRAAIAAVLRKQGCRAALITLPDSLCWLLNIRGGDIAHNPVVQAFGVLHDDARVTLFLEPERATPELRDHLGADVTLRPPAALEAALRTLQGPVRLDPATAPLYLADTLAEAGVETRAGQDPCILPKARKSAAEIAGMEAAHLRDGAAMVEFLCWLDAEAPNGNLTEIDVVRRLEECRAATGRLHDISFDTICGAGPNGAIVHYRVTEATNRAVRPGDVLLVDSGAQYPDGTTDITRTIATGPVPPEARTAATRVLQGMIAMSRARWPKGLAGRDLDALARYPLWLAGQDYDHGTGHGIGAFLSVHEGPQRLSRLSEVALEPGMIVSNEPGYYREAAFGIRIENLLVVVEAAPLPGADQRDMLAFDTLTHVPIDRRMIDIAALSAAERAWFDAYHARVHGALADRVGPAARAWLDAATAPL